MPQLPPWWYLCRDMACPCNLNRCLQCEELIMALRRNPQRNCQERLPPSFVAIPYQSNDIPLKETTAIARERQSSAHPSTKRYAIKSRRRRERTLARQLPGAASDKPFPFFELPREIRDQVYASLVIRQPGTKHSIIAAAPLLEHRKKRFAVQANRERENQRRLLAGKRPVQARLVEPEPIVDLNLLQASQQLNFEAKDCLYTHNWFALVLNRLPLTTFETPYGWDLSRITRLQVEVQIKDAAHMNSYVDWTAFFTSFPSLRFLRVIPTFHPRYHDWVLPELSEWSETHYVHKAFFRELLATVPSHLNLELGIQSDTADDLHLQAKPISGTLIKDMYAELGLSRVASIARC
ncbi:hypothetical protein CC86DRAFT_398956 [Ophiobolus disseminans]|uniref:Uncharacterized protein n=1 Tax=Ophiobolus disseminans TaxID=1469910 RepID=A0A6A6ZDC8_9PLEO|nr:hypothetical protein CC86DRAFT_398956 [Ophiobolus disseminans]